MSYWRGLVIREGELPPASGRARTQYCLEKGLKALSEAQRSYGQSLIAIVDHLRGGISALPTAYPLHEPLPEVERTAVGRQRVHEWRSTRSRALRGTASFRRSPARAIATRSLAAAVDAYNWLDDVGHDLTAETPIDANSFDDELGGVYAISDLLRLAHFLVHAAGEFVGGLYGCTYVRESDGLWYDYCPVRLVHFRYGLSAGFTARRVCNICEQDAGECHHNPGQQYERAADGKLKTFTAGYVMRDPVMHEASLTPRPRDPMARIKSMSVDTRELEEVLGENPTPGDIINDPSCLFPCAGFDTTSFDYF